MKKNILTLFSLAILLTAVSCSTPSTDSASAVSKLESTANRSVPAANEEEDLNLLLARKWENASGEIFIDLKIDGSFEGKFDSDNTILGSWSVSDDQKTLSLKEENTSDGKGGTLNLSYTILNMSFNNMKVLDQDGNELAFVSPE
jgi:hypothetical protein